MAGKRAQTRQVDIQRAVRAVTAAGLEVGKVEVEPATGKIVVTTRSEGAGSESTLLDQWLANHARNH